MIHINHPDDTQFDEIHIKTVERWKESELSGDEWRFSYVADIKRKGETIITISTGRWDWLLMGLQWKILTAGENGNIDQEAWNRTKDKCDQPGCSNDPVVFLKLIKRWDKEGNQLAPDSYYDGNVYRQFCEKHTDRGDCGLDDADRNYKEIENPNKENNNG